MTSNYKTLLTEMGFYPTDRPQATNGPLTEADVEHIEEKLGHSLPQDYRQFLLECSELLAGDVDYFSFRNKNGPEEASPFSLYGGDVAEHYFGQHRALESDDNYNLDNYPGVRLIRDIRTSSYQIGWPEELLPIGIGHGNDEICLAFKGVRHGAIFFWKVNPWQDEDNIYFVANSFDEFIHMLKKPDDEIAPHGSINI